MKASCWFLISSQCASKPGSRLRRCAPALFRWMHGSERGAATKNLPTLFTGGSLWRRSHACKKTGSNQRRLSSHGTLQPPLGDCDLVAGHGTLRDIWKSFSTHMLQKIKSEIWADILQMSVKWDNWARPQPQPDAGTEARDVICCIDSWTTVFSWHMVTDVSLCEHLTQKRWSSLSAWWLCASSPSNTLFLLLMVLLVFIKDWSSVDCSNKIKNIIKRLLQQQ